MRKCENGLLKCITYDMILILICWILIFLIFLPYTKPGFAYGADVQAHFYMAEYIAKYFSEYHKIPHWDLNWYAGFSILHNIPPFVYIVLAFLLLLVKDIQLVYKMYVFLSIFFTASWSYLKGLMVQLWDIRYFPLVYSQVQPQLQPPFFTILFCEERAYV
jgi:uncharacterized membrane protein